MWMRIRLESTMLLCPVCLSPRLSFPDPPAIMDPSTGYIDAEEPFVCNACGETGYAEDVIDQPDADDLIELRPDAEAA